MSRAHVLLLACILFPLFVNLHTPALWDGSEPFYAETAREMVESGDWWTLHYNYRPRWEKPPLPVWLVAASYSVFGVSEWAARLPLALTAAAILLGAYWLGSLLGKSLAGLIAAVVIGTALKFFEYTRQYAGDLLLTLAFVLFLGLFLRWAQSDGRRTGSLRAAAIVLGLGLLIKGPIGIFPALIVVAYLAARRRLALLTWRAALESAALVTLISLPWFAYQAAFYGPDYLRVFFIEQNLQRVTTSRFGTGQPWYYVPAILFGALPGSLLFFWAALDSLRRLSPWTRRSDSAGPGWRDSSLLFPALWFVLVFLFFSLARGKREVYMLPLFPAMGLIAGLWLDDALQRARRAALTLAAGSIALFFLGLAGIGISVWVLPGTVWGLVLTGFGGLAGFLIFGFAIRQCWNAAGVVSIISLAVLVWGAALSMSPLAAYRPVPQFAELIRLERRPGDRVAAYLADVPSLMFYTRGMIEICESREQFRALLARLPAQPANAEPRVFAVMPEWVYVEARMDFSQYRWDVLSRRPYFQLIRSNLRHLRSTGMLGDPYVLARISRLP